MKPDGEEDDSTSKSFQIVQPARDTFNITMTVIIGILKRSWIYLENVII